MIHTFDKVTDLLKSTLEDRRFFVVAMVILVVAIMVLLFPGDLWGDLDHYYQNVSDVLSGKMPYSDMVFEYPPLSLIFMLIPKIFTWDLESFHYGCTVLAFVFVAIGAYYLIRIADQRIGCRWQTHLILMMLLVFGSYFVVARNDIYPAVFVIIAFWFYLNDKFVLAFAIMAVAAMIKMYPAIFLIPMIVPFILRGEWKRTFLYVLTAIAVCLIVELPFLIADPSTAFAYLTYHSDRGVQVESVVASFFMVYNILIPGDLTVVFGYGSDNLSGVGPDAIAPYMNFIAGAVLLSFIIVMAIRMRRVGQQKKTGPMVALISVTMVMIFILFSKVYSAQYLIWILMLMPLTQMSCFDETYKRLLLVILLPFGLFSVCSYVGYNTLGLVQLDPAAICFVFLKNIFHILLTVILLRMCWVETRVPAKGMNEANACEVTS